MHHIIKHTDDLDIGTTVSRTFQGTDRSSDNGVSICQGTCDNMSGEGRVITTAVLHMQNKCYIQYLCFQWGIGAVRS